nr:auxin response factor 3 [Quercus suber]
MAVAVGGGGSGCWQWQWIDLNTSEEDEMSLLGSSSTSSSSFSVAGLNTSGGLGSNLVVGALASAASSSVCLELWHACAGPLISLLKKGRVVVYFPQGQLE